MVFALHCANVMVMGGITLPAGGEPIFMREFFHEVGEASIMMVKVMALLTGLEL